MSSSMGNRVTQHNIHLILFLSRATPLKVWHQRGIISREIAIYKAFAQKFRGLSIVTSGDSEELNYVQDTDNIEILYNRWGLNPNLYSLLAPFLHRKSLKSTSIYKTNQLDGSWAALLAGMMFSKPVIVRAGYTWAKNYQRTNPSTLKSIIIKFLERISIKRATACMVTTVALGKFYSSEYQRDIADFFISPNYTDTDKFSPMPNIPKISGRICFIGRLSSEKNIHLLIRAIGNNPENSLQIIGEGQQRSYLERYTKEQSANVLFSGIVPHNELPKIINQSEVFILPSKFEGHPKALIEAMACGVPVVGTDVEGIQDIIDHERTGLLCKPTVGSIQSSLRKLFAEPLLRAELGKNARQYIIDNYSIDKIVANEVDLICYIYNAFLRNSIS